MTDPVINYACKRCGWTGTKPAVTEVNLEARMGADGRMHEPIAHVSVCRLCYGDVTRTLVSGNNVMSMGGLPT